MHLDPRPRCQPPIAQRALFRVMFGGLPLMALSQLPLNPTPVRVAPGSRLPFQLALVSAAFTPFVVPVPFHDWVKACPSAHCQRTVQPLIGTLLVFVMSRPTWKKPGQLVVIVYVTEQVVGRQVVVGHEEHVRRLMSAAGMSVLSGDDLGQGVLEVDAVAVCRI